MNHPQARPPAVSRRRVVVAVDSTSSVSGEGTSSLMSLFVAQVVKDIIHFSMSLSADTSPIVNTLRRHISHIVQSIWLYTS